jgi:hypothetical protein
MTSFSRSDQSPTRSHSRIELEGFVEITFSLLTRLRPKRTARSPPPLPPTGSPHRIETKALGGAHSTLTVSFP